MLKAKSESLGSTFGRILKNRFCLLVLAKNNQYSFKTMNLFEVHKIFLGSLDEQSQFKVDITIYEIIRYHHLEKVEVSQYVSYPENQTYFLYGDKGNAYISHIMTKYPDFHQVCILTQREKCPHSEFFWSVFSRIRTEYGPENSDYDTSHTVLGTCQMSTMESFAKIVDRF